MANKELNGTQPSLPEKNNGKQEYSQTKPIESRKEEYKIRQSLIEQGVSKEIADAVIGYTPDQVPFVYAAEPHKVIDGNSGEPMMSQIMIGTTDQLHNLDITWGDQAPEVIVQWRGYTYFDANSGAPKKNSISRQEVHHLPNGSFVRLEYHRVSSIGEFDGDLVNIELNVPKGTFRPYGGPDERREYQIYQFRRYERRSSESGILPWKNLVRKNAPQHEWVVNLEHSNVSGTTILNGLAEMLTFHLSNIKTLKADQSKAYGFTALPHSDTAVIPAYSEEEIPEIIKNEKDPKIHALIESRFPVVLWIMQELAPLVREVLIHKDYNRDVQQMAIDGVLRHPEKIQILGKSLAEWTREQRFSLAQIISRAIEGGKFTEWLDTQAGAHLEELLQDTANRNTRSLLDWLGRNFDSEAKITEWIVMVERGMKTYIGKDKKNQNRSNGEREFGHSFDGMMTSFLERFIEYIAQQYQGNFLTSKK